MPEPRDLVRVGEMLLCSRQDSIQVSWHRWSLFHQPVPIGSTANPREHCTILSPLAAYGLGGISCPKGTLTLIQPSKRGGGPMPPGQSPTVPQQGGSLWAALSPKSFGCSL